MNFNDLNGIERSEQLLDGYKKYASMSEDELLKTLIDKVGEQKREGKFDGEALERMYLVASSSLNEGQRERMRKIIDMLKG